MFAPTGHSNSKNCLDNLGIFIRRAVVLDPKIYYRFILIGTTPIPSSLKYIISKIPSITITRVANEGIDLCVHANGVKDTLKETNNSLSDYDLYMFLNCGARGPYFGFSGNKDASSDWIYYFSHKIDDVTKAVGPTISCEQGPHIQTYAIAIHHSVMNIVLDYWSVCDHRKKLDKHVIIKTSEIGLSEAILSNQFNIASTSMYHNWDFRNPKLMHCGRLQDNDLRMNPTACYGEGCKAYDPCELVFVKYGGDILKYGLLASYTMNRIHEEDKKWKDSDITYSNCDNSLGWMKTETAT